MPTPEYAVRPVAVVRSTLRDLAAAPMQGDEGAPNAWLEFDPSVAEAKAGLKVGQQILLITWLHRADREILKVHPRDDRGLPLTGVFATRSPDRPNPIGIHPVRILELKDGRLLVGPLEAIDGTPVLDIKPVILPAEAG
jgi:tRNA-Thr(GGU) m(6)t(6)A37 methyltransferase TsaA